MSKDNLLFELGNRIYERRKELNMTQEDLAEEIGLSIQSISCIELGKKAVRPENLAKICHALDISADYLLFGLRDEKQLPVVTKALSSLDKTDFELVKHLIERLSDK